MLPRRICDEDVELFRGLVREFVEREIEPFHAQWETDGQVPRELWARAGAAGLLCPDLPEALGGAGTDFRFSAVVSEELSRVGASGPGFFLHSDIVAPYILHLGSEAQKRAWLPRMAAGEVIGAVAMTEPGTGSDLQAVATRAVRDGDAYVVDGCKTFVSNGQLADLVITVCRTGRDEGARGLSLLLVETDRAGVTKGRNLAKVGLKAQDTSELFLDGVRVPVDNLLGEEGRGFAYLMQELPRERLAVAVIAVSSAEAVLEQTITYTKQRQAFGRPLIDFQNTRYTLAGLKAEVAVGRVFVDRCIEELLQGTLSTEAAAAAKLWTSEMQFRVIDACMQLHGGYGYMWEYPVARAWADARVQRIYAGTSEMMKELICRSL